MKKFPGYIFVFIAIPIFAEVTQPNFVFILADDMGWTGTSVQIDPNQPGSKSDYHETPALEKLAAQSMLFSRAYSPGSLCTPSRAAILTGKTPAELHMTAPGGGRTRPYQKMATPEIIHELPESELTIAELLSQQGYSTAYFGKWHQGQVSPGKHGFDVHDGPTGNEVPEPKMGPKDIFGVNNRAMEFIEAQVKEERPFYVQLSHWAVHGPFESSPTSEEKFSRMQKGQNHSDPVYAGMTYDLDASVGILLEKIEELDLSGSTYVIFMSDNGAPGNRARPQNAPLRAGKATLYEGGIRVPLMIRGPGIEPGSVCPVNVMGCDLLPTICDLAGIKLNHDVAGSSLMTLLKGEFDSFVRAKTLLFHFPHYGQNPRLFPQTAVIQDNYKLIRNLESGELELYDLDEDIGEEMDLSRRLPEIISRMEGLMDTRLQQTHAQLMQPNPNYNPEAAVVSRGQPGIRQDGVADGGQGPRQTQGPQAFMERFDKNKDGKVTRDEFDGPAPRFQRMDINGDGIVTSEEAPTGPPARRRPQ